ncbi:AzlD domain-containing protein [Neptuniibacter halophilus]|uniref:AzlD domain-containing protein n=1 Tax=Neptuniibacter halophilus TaxID=651666 RepID=UPI0025738C7F|nr:AzlD domain-containing protein [Neptuniibacter halophilus]
MLFWLLMLGMAALVFASRYLFLEPRLPLKLNEEVLRLLSYSAPAVLAAVIAPLVFVHQEQVDISTDNPYLLGAVAAIGLMLITRNTLLTATLSMGLFLWIS